MYERTDRKNIAIIAHVDHGKTTLVDAMLRQSGVFRENQAVAERVMDSGELEKERGITITSKNTAINWNGVKINIVDTPGHADFGGEVERVLGMVSGVLVLVDAFEGPMPQTRFVLQKALALGLTVIIVVNKVDRLDARPREVVEDTQLLMMELGATDEQLDSPVLYVSAKEGTATRDLSEEPKDLTPLFETILQSIPSPVGDINAPFQMLVSTIDYNDYVGRIAIGRVERGKVAIGNEIILCNDKTGKVSTPTRATGLFSFNGLEREPVTEVHVGEIVALSGIENIGIGDTICPPDHADPLPFVDISRPTVVMTFSVNDSPFAGQEGKFVTSRQIRARLEREVQSDAALRIEDSDRTDAFKVYGRGELHLSILIETMRRQGYEFQVSKPDVLFRDGPNGKEEPLEEVIIDVPGEYIGAVMEKMGNRKAEIVSMQSRDERSRLHFIIPARCLFGYRGELLTDTRGEGIMNTIFAGYGPYRGELQERRNGTLIATQQGVTTPYALFAVQSRGEFFIGPGTRVYEGMVIGACNRAEDIEVNVCKEKKLTNMRASGKDDNVMLSAHTEMTLEQAIEYISEDELVEITPKNIRIRKKILNAGARTRSRKN